MTERYEFTSWLSGPRWADLAGVVIKTGMGLDVTVEINDETSSWIRKTIYFKAIGYQQNLAAFRQALADYANN